MRGHWDLDLWHCEVCDQRTKEEGPWCDLYNTQKGLICRPVVIARLKVADATGDGPMVNALCEYGRSHWGPGLFW